MTRGWRGLRLRRGGCSLRQAACRQVALQNLRPAFGCLISRPQIAQPIPYAFSIDLTD